MEKKSKIYIAGHTGMAGSAIFRYLSNSGYDNLVVKTHSEMDLLDQKSVFDFFDSEKIEYVFLAAAKVGGIKKNINYPADMLLDNLKIQNNVIEAAYRFKVKKMLFLGSSCIYPRLSLQPMKEEFFLTGPFEPTNEGYAIAKVAGLRLCEYYNRQYNTNFISLMPCNLYGTNDHYDENGHVLSSLILKFHNAKVNGYKEVEVWGSGNQRREFLFSDDLADASVYFMNNYNGSDFINIGSGIDYSIKELANIISKVVGYNGNIVFNTNMPDGMPRKLLDTSKAEKLGWKFKTKLEEGLRITYDDFLLNNAKMEK